MGKMHGAPLGTCAGVTPRPAGDWSLWTGRCVSDEISKASLKVVRLPAEPARCEPPFDRMLDGSLVIEARLDALFIDPVGKCEVATDFPKMSPLKIGQLV